MKCHFTEKEVTAPALREIVRHNQATVWPGCQIFMIPTHYSKDRETTPTLSRSVYDALEHTCQEERKNEIRAKCQSGNGQI